MVKIGDHLWRTKHPIARFPGQLTFVVDWGQVTGWGCCGEDVQSSGGYFETIPGEHSAKMSLMNTVTGLFVNLTQARLKRRLPILNVTTDPIPETGIGRVVSQQHEDVVAAR